MSDGSPKGYERQRTSKPTGKQPFEPAPDDFNPVWASQDDLVKFGYSPRPHAEEQPQLFAAWAELFSAKLHFIELASNEKFVGPPPQVAPPRVSETRFENSRNWSGGYLEPSGGNMFMQIFGKWTVPTPKLPAGSPANPAMQTLYDCSTWVGLDGQRRYFNSSLPQVGTEQMLTVDPNGTQTLLTRAWFQWFARNETTIDQRYIPEVPVQPGDRVIMHLWVHGKSDVRVYCHNLTTHILFGFPASAPVINGATPVIAGATAEWVMERPTIPGKDTMYAFPNYSSVTFSQCVAGAAPGPGPAGSQHVLQGTRFIRMYDVLTNPMRTSFISMPSLVSATSLKTTYGGFQ
jgi:hypothetical protein